jgi:membrane-bound lytic murein transglycosylase F
MRWHRGWLLVALPLVLAARVTAPAADPPADQGVAESLAQAARAREAARITNRYDPWFKKYTKRYFGIGTDWRLFKSQGVAESELNPKARSAVGARGIMQLMPATFATISNSRTWMTSVDAPEANIAAGILHDHDLWEVWSRKVADEEVPRFSFASYNAGEGTIFRASGVAAAAKLDPTRWENIAQVAPKVRNWRHAETLGYVKKIESTYETLRAVR